MTPARHAQIKEIFLTASELAPERVGPYLTAVCGSDDELRQEVEWLLEEHARNADPPGQTGNARSSDTRPPGELVANRYRLRRTLGRGGMGDVYEADDTTLGVPVALKFLRSPSEAGLERLLNEVRLARTIIHPAMCRVFDVQESDGTHFLTMEYIDGEDLHGLLARIGRLAPERVIEIGIELAQGLAAAHARGVLHRDIKPANVMLDLSGSVRITDFGIAAGGSWDEASREVAGTPAYMAPEQLDGQARVSERTDIYGLGVTLYEALTGRPAYEARDYPEARSAHQQTRLPAPSELVAGIAPEFEAHLLRAMDLTPDARFESAEAFADALGSLRNRSGERETSAPGSSPSVDGERRHVTVLSAQLLNYEELTRGRDPEELREVLLAYQWVCSRGVAPYGDQLVQQTAGRIAVHFGYPEAHEDSAERALLASLGILAELELVNRDRPASLSIAIGVHTGPVVVQPADATTEEPTVFGDVGDVAAEIESLASPGEILASEATLRLVPGLFRTSEAARSPTSSPITVRRIHESTGGNRLEVATELTSFVNRTQELGLLIDRWEQVCEGEGQVVLVSGEAGIGKSRLVRVLRENLMGVSHRWLDCRCSPYHQATPFHPIVQLIERSLGIKTGDPDETREDRFRERAPSGVDDEELPFVRGILALDPADSFSSLAPELQRRRTLDALANWILAQAEPDPMVLFVDDVHWADASSLELLREVLEEVPTARILLIASYRSGFETGWPRRSHVAPLSVNPLRRQEVRELVRGAARRSALSDELVADLADRAGGNPIFAEELTRATLETNDATTESLSSPPIPDTLQAALESRLDRLSSAKQVAQICSTLGRDFSYDRLAAIADLDDFALQAGLEKLIDAEILRKRGSPPRATYAFRHALLRDAAYETMLHARRASLHSRIADHLAAEDPAQPSLIAMHLEAARRDEDAIQAWTDAGIRALARVAPQDAMKHLTRALELHRRLAPAAASRRELDIRLALSAALLFGHAEATDRALSNLRRTERLAQDLGDRDVRTEALYGIWMHTIARGSREARGAAEQVWAATEDEKWAATRHYVRGETALWSGELARAGTHLREALERRDDFRIMEDGYFSEDARVWLPGVASVATLLLGDFKRARNLLEEAIRATRETRETQHRITLAGTLHFSAWEAQLVGDGRACLAASSELREFATTQAAPIHAALGRCLEGWAKTWEGDPASGLAMIREGLSRYPTHSSYLEPMCRALYVDVLLANGRVPEARAAGEATLEGMNDRLEQVLLPEIWRTLGEALRAEGRDGEAENALRRSLDIARGSGALLFEIRAATSLARLWNAVDRGESAHTFLGTLLDKVPTEVDLPVVRQAREELARPRSRG